MESREEVKSSTGCEITDGCQGREHHAEIFWVSTNDRLCPGTVQLLVGSTEWLSLSKTEGWSGRRWCQKRSLHAGKVERSRGEWPCTTQSWGSPAACSPSGMPETAPVWEPGGFSLCSNFTAGYCCDLGARQINPVHFYLAITNKSESQPQ